MSHKNKAKTPRKADKPSMASTGDWGLWMVMIAAMALYAVSIKFDFVLDDEIMVRGNKFVNRGIAGIGDIFTHGTLFGFNGMNDQSYRPLMLAVFAVEKSLFGGSPTAFHFFNVLYYALACGIFYLLLKKALGRGSILPLMSALLFAAHPIHTEVVANIKSRDEILSFLLVALSLFYLVTYLREGEKRRHILLSLWCYLAAALAKETGLAMLGLIPLTLWFFSDQKLPRIAGITLLYLAPVSVYFLMRISAMDNLLFSSDIHDVINNSLSGAANGGEWFASRMMILGKYLGLLFFPHPLSYDYSYHQVPLVGLGDPSFIAAFLTYLVLAGLFFWGLPKKQVFAYAIGFYMVMLILVSNFLTPIGATMAERFLFSASAGFCLALAWGLKAMTDRFEQPNTALYVVTGVILLLYSIKTLTRTQVWATQLTLFESGLITAPNSARAQNHYGSYWRMRAEGIPNPQDKNRASYLEKSVVYYKKALDIYPQFTEAQYNLGVSLLALNKSEDAQVAFENTLKLDSLYEGAINNLAVIAFRKGDNATALAYWNRLLTINPDNFDALLNSGALYFNTRQPKKALEYFEKAQKIHPEHQGCLQNIEKVKAMLNAPGDQE